MGDEVAVLGPYKLLEQLNVGRLAELYLATKPGEAGFEKKVVIKRLLPGLETDEPSKASFIHEAKLAAKLIHPRIAQTFELGSEGDTLYVAMEHVDGVALDTLARRLAARGRRLEPQLAVWIAHQMLDALDFAHQSKVVHGELSPSKVLISFGGDVKIVGFGAMAVAAGEGETWRDVFATGVVLAELLTGHRLFAGANDLRVMRLKLERFERSLVDVEVALADIVRRALRTATDIRWDGAGFREALGEWLFEKRHRVTNQHLATIVSRIDNLDALPEIQVARGPAPEARASAEFRAVGTGPIAPVAAPAPKRPSIEIPAIKVPPVAKRAPSAPSTTEIAFDDLGEPLEASSLAPEQGEPDEFGDLALAPALSLVWKRLTTRSTGKLVIALPAVKKEIYFTEGRPESTASNIASEQLGNYLVASGALTTGELSLVLATREHRGGEMEDLLIDLGLVESRELRRHWSELTRESIVDILTWKKGAYEWYPGRAPRSPLVRFEGNPYELLGVGALRLDERLVVPASKAQLDRRLQAAPARVDPSSFGLADLPDLLAAVDGKSSVDEIARNQPDRLRAYRILYLLEACELVHEVRRDHA